MVSLFCEGLLDAATLRRIVEQKSSLDIGIVISGKGKPYLCSKSIQLNESARGHPVIILADQDHLGVCAASQIATWLGGRLREPNFLIRFARLSVEAWLLADRLNISNYLGVETRIIPANVENLPNPKSTMIELARRSRKRDVREGLVPSIRSRATIGPNYNADLIKFVSERWDIDNALIESDSLRRAVQRIQELDARFRK